MSFSSKHDTTKSEIMFNRVFILGGRGLSEDAWRKHFAPFGRIVKVAITTDKHTGREKGITYISFAKTSQCCKAQEEMNGKYLEGQEKPVKVIIAADRKAQAKPGVEEDSMLKKIFVMFPKEMNEDELRDTFKQFGDIDYVRMVKARKSNSPRNLAYIKYIKQSSAAMAFEECDRDYKAIFADVKTMEELEKEGAFSSRYDEPRGSDYGRGRGGDDYESDRHGSYGGRGYRGDYDEDRYGNGSRFSGRDSGVVPMEVVKDSQRGLMATSSVVEVCVSGRVSENHVRRLCDVVPGLVNYHCDAASGVAYATYTSPSCAMYAVDKLNNFEYPIDCPLTVKLQGGGYAGGSLNAAGPLLTSNVAGFSSSSMSEGTVQSLVESITKATSALQQSGLAGSLGGFQGSGQEIVPWCNIPLPYKKPFAPRESQIEQRLFIVSQQAFPDRYLEEAFCRFGDLISAYFMPGKGFGYAKYANKDAALEAIQTLHGQQICGNRVKVMEAEPQRYQEDTEYRGHSKRMREGYD